MIFEKLEFASNNKYLLTRARTPSISRSVHFRYSMRKKTLAKHLESFQEQKETITKENMKNLKSFPDKIRKINYLPNVLQEKMTILKEDNAKTRYVRAYTPNEEMLDAMIETINKREPKLSCKLTPRKAYRRLTDKASREINLEGLVGWIDK